MKKVPSADEFELIAQVVAVPTRRPEKLGRDPFFIKGPAVISFSGGRTSGYMLWRILQAHDGKLPDDVYVMFANTGLED